MDMSLENSKLVDLNECQLEEINGGSVGLLILACVGIAAICYYCGEHSAR